MKLISLTLFFIFLAVGAEAKPIKVIFGGVGKSFERSGETALTEDQKWEEKIYDEILSSETNWEPINHGLEDFFVNFSNESKEVDINFFGIGAKEEQKQVDDIHALVAVLSFDKVISFEEKIFFNNQENVKKTVYAAFSLYLLELADKKLVFSRPFIIPFTVLKDDIKIYQENILGGVQTFFSDSKLWEGNKKILEKCLNDPATIFDHDAETYGTVEVALSEGTLKNLDEKEEEKMRNLAGMLVNSFLSYSRLVIPTQSYTEGEFAQLANMAAISLNIFMRSSPNSSKITYDKKEGKFEIGLKLPKPVNPVKVSVKTGQKVLEEKKFHNVLQFKALAQLDIWDHAYKCLDAVTISQARDSGIHSNIQYFNALINAISKLKGGLDACSK